MRRYYFKSKPNSYCYQTFSLYFFQCTSRLGAIPSSFHHRLCCSSCSLSFVHLSICIWRPRICIFVLWSFELIVKAALAHCSLLSLWVVGKIEYELNEVLCVSNARPICFDLFLRLLFHCDDISIVIEIFALEFGIVDWGKTENLKVRSQSELAGLVL